MSDFHPGKVSYSTSTLCKTSILAVWERNPVIQTHTSHYQIPRPKFYNSTFVLCGRWITREMGNSFPIEFVCNSNFNFIQHIQNVKFCQSNAVWEGKVKKKKLLMEDSFWWCPEECQQNTWPLASTGQDTHAEKPLIMCAYLTMTRSNQPQRLFLPVVTPTSCPRVCSSSPTAWSTAKRRTPKPHGPYRVLTFCPGCLLSSRDK